MNSLEESVNLLFQILDTYDKLSDGLKELFLKRRETLSWGSYGKDGNQPRKEIFIKDLSDLHICAILETQQHIKGTPTEWLLKIEQSYRKEKGIEVREP